MDDRLDKVICDCGATGHLGAIASGRGIERFARRQANEDHRGFKASLCAQRFNATADTLNNEHHLIPAALSGDDWTLSIIRECTEPLAKTLIAVTLAAGLEKVIIIGGFALQMGEAYLTILRSLLKSNCDYQVLKDCAEGLVMLGGTEEEACLEGAAVYARQQLAAFV